jgi:hypothetical protein
MMLIYALTSSQSLHETLDLFLTREAAEAELREILEDEPPTGETCSGSCRSHSTVGRCRRISAKSRSHGEVPNEGPRFESRRRLWVLARLRLV